MRFFIFQIVSRSSAIGRLFREVASFSRHLVRVDPQSTEFRTDPGAIQRLCNSPETHGPRWLVSRGFCGLFIVLPWVVGQSLLLCECGSLGCLGIPIISLFLLSPASC